jgi:hypothetical protein
MSSRETRTALVLHAHVALRVRVVRLLAVMSPYVCHGQRVAARATVVQQKTSKPVQFDITESRRSALADWIRLSGLASDDFLFQSRFHASPHFLSTRQYARITDSWSRKWGLIRPY